MIPYEKRRRNGRPRIRYKNDVIKITGPMWERVAYNWSGWLVAGKDQCPKMGRVMDAVIFHKGWLYLYSCKAVLVIIIKCIFISSI